MVFDTMIAAEAVLPKKTLKIKFSSQQREAAHGTKVSEQQSSFARTWVSCATVDEHSHPRMGEPQISASGVNKRGPPSSEECPREKRPKMDRSLSQRCASLVKSLVRHPAGWVFKEPVDPVKLNIPDYFSIIKKPMDLGTIKSKLDKNRYDTAEEFAADVRLTFSNAMLFNPPTNAVHQMADELNELFETQWRSLQGKCSRDGPKSVNAKLSATLVEQKSDLEQTCPRTPVHRSVVLLKRRRPSNGKVMRSTLDSRPADVKFVRLAENCVDKSSWKNSVKGIESIDKLACASVSAHSSVMVVATKCVACGMNTCQCNFHGDPAPASSDLSYEIPIGIDACDPDASKLGHQANVIKASKITKSDQESDGAVSALDEETICPSSELNIGTDATSGEGWGVRSLDVQLSPTKALRAAILKKRFADTILKAQHKTLLDQGDKSDPLKMRLEKERLEKRQQEERARIEAQIKAAEAAARKREEMELRKQREREREAARVALQQMEKTAEIELNLEILKELEKLSGGSLIYSPRLERGRGKAAIWEEDNLESPLERLGLFMKDEAEDEEVLNVDGEEGEILF